MAFSLGLLAVTAQAAWGYMGLHGVFGRADGLGLFGMSHRLHFPIPWSRTFCCCCFSWHLDGGDGCCLRERGALVCHAEPDHPYIHAIVIFLSFFHAPLEPGTMGDLNCPMRARRYEKEMRAQTKKYEKDTM